MTWIAPLKDLLFGPKREVKELIPEIEEKFLIADVGVATTQFLIEALKKAAVKTGEEAYEFLKSEVEQMLKSPPAPLFQRGEIECSPFQRGEVSSSPPFSKGGSGGILTSEGEGGFPNVWFFVGVNGVGKTTTIGKFAARFKNEGLKVLCVAADTFRAAARDQLKIWADRSQSEFVFGADNADPASVVFDGCEAAKARKCGIVLIDTAGRLQTKTNLMEELKKMVRVAEKALSRPAGAAGPAGAARPPSEILLVLDATTGQNGLSQARVFLNVVPLTGLILTKYDSTAKGGILISVVRETGLPLRFVGIGEKIEDLKLFDAHEFVQVLFA